MRALLRPPLNSKASISVEANARSTCSVWKRRSIHPQPQASSCSVFGAIAHFERRLISERTKDGVAAARAKGRQPGRQPLDM
ncbi:recombinase family protein [Mesorhizobium sp. M0622]